MFIGKFNRTVIITYLGTLSVIIGSYLALHEQNITGAIICLIFAGICDMFDGKVARMVKNRTEEDKEYGVQIDSLADTLAFLAYPIIILFGIISKDGINISPILIVLISTVFAVCGVTRLAFFNLSTKNEEGGIKYYSGLPVTLTSVILPLLYLFNPLVSDLVFAYIYLFALLVIAFLFILNFKLKKPKSRAFFIVIPIIAILTVIFMIFR